MESGVWCLVSGEQCVRNAFALRSHCERITQNTVFKNYYLYHLAAKAPAILPLQLSRSEIR
jgi:hypothetical protein